MDYRNKYYHWLQSHYVDLQTKQELSTIAVNEAEVEDRFFRNLEFGTGGLRGRLGAGTNRMNRYVVRFASQGLSNYLLEQVLDGATKGVVIAYDTRHLSQEFAKETAAVLNGNGIKVYLFEEPRPTPELSFAVRELGAGAGVVITASHNPPEYNGYKVYGLDGCQIVSNVADAIVTAVKAVTEFSMVTSPMPAEVAQKRGLLEFLGEEMDQRFSAAVKRQMVDQIIAASNGAHLSIVYSPLHGTGLSIIPKLFHQAGFRSLTLVDEQLTPDPRFSTVRVPNPEEEDAYTLALEKAETIAADLIMLTDPDADRLGLMVRDTSGKYVLLTGNQTGALLMDYVLKARQDKNQLQKGATVIKTIVTSEFGRAIADNYGVDMVDTLTGFKYIGEKISELESGCDRSFVLGYEESFGYLIGTHVRDKDAVVASLLIAEMALSYKLRGLTLLEVLEQLQQRHGYYREQLLSWTLDGKDGQALIGILMHQFRIKPPPLLGGLRVTEVRDYLLGAHHEQTLPRENTLKFMLEHGSWVCVRPSGTEPKIKFYLASVAETATKAEEMLERLQEGVRTQVETVIRAAKEAAAGEK